MISLLLLLLIFITVIIIIIIIITVIITSIIINSNLKVLENIHRVSGSNDQERLKEKTLRFYFEIIKL